MAKTKAETTEEVIIKLRLRSAIPLSDGRYILNPDDKKKFDEYMDESRSRNNTEKQKE